MPQKASPFASTNVNASVTQLLAWVANEAKTAGKDEAQILDTSVTHLAEYVQAGDSWAVAYDKVKAEFVAAQTNEWQKLAFDAIGELAAVVDQFKSVVDGFVALIP